MDLNLTGASSLRIYCEKFLVILNDSRIILNGRSGRDEDKSYLASAGESGGEFLLTAESIENGQGLTVYSYGGKGGDGMDGYTAPDIHSQNIKDLYKLHTFYDFNSFKNRAESWYDNSSLICADLNSGGYVIAKNCSYSQGNVCGPSTDGIPGRNLIILTVAFSLFAGLNELFFRRRSWWKGREYNYSGARSDNPAPKGVQ